MRTRVNYENAYPSYCNTLCSEGGCSQSTRATKLRHAPLNIILIYDRDVSKHSHKKNFCSNNKRFTYLDYNSVNGFSAITSQPLL